MRYQPQGLLRVDQSNPITRGLQVWQTGASDGIFANTNGVTVTATPSGLAKGYTAASSQYLSAPDDRIGTAPLTFFALAQISAASGDKALISIGAGTADRHLLYFTAVDRVAMFSGASSPAATAQAVNGAAVAENKLHAVGGRVLASNSRDVWLNGVKAATNTTSVVPLSTNKIALGAYWNAGAASFFLDGSMPLALAWNRALSDDEMRSLSLNPWQVFQSPEEDYEVAAAAGTSGTFASTLDAAPMSASGQIIHAGSFSSALDSITMSSSGNVGVNPSGSMVSTLDSMAMSATGTLNDSGSFLATLGDCTMAANGTAAPHASGTMAATLGDATMNASGTGNAALLFERRSKQRTQRILRRHFTN